MDDMTAFERQLSGEIAGLMGPARPVDDLAVYESVIAARRQHRWGFTMFSALKFATASVILALFGGFLMMGVFTMQQDEEVPLPAVSSSPTTETTAEPTEAQTTSVRTDILPGVAVAVEEVEPGVFHVLNDGVQDLILGGNTDVVAGHDDAIWLLRKNRFFRLGSEAGQAWPEAGRAYPSHFEVTPDGVVWVIRTDEIPTEEDDIRIVNTLFSSDGDGWTRAQSPPGDVFAIAIAPDGTLWASWDGGDGVGGFAVGYLGPSGWQPLDGEMNHFTNRLHPTASGDIYGESCFMGCRVQRYEDAAWSVFTGAYEAFDVALDGTVWLFGGFDDLPPEWRAELPGGEPSTAFERDGAHGLARFTGGAWEGWAHDDLPDVGLGMAFEGSGSLDRTFMAAPDGSLWASLWQHGPDGPDLLVLNGLWTPGQRAGVAHYDPQCDGLVRFDGETADRFLSGRCITVDIAADGSVWVLADKDEGKDLYVITPEAVAADE